MIQPTPMAILRRPIRPMFLDHIAAPVMEETSIYPLPCWVKPMSFSSNISHSSIPMVGKVPKISQFHNVSYLMFIHVSFAL